MRGRLNPQRSMLGFIDLEERVPPTHPLRAIKAIFGHTPALPTFPSFRPALALDRIWIRPTGRLKSIAVHRTRLSARASDHLPLKAVVEWDSEENTDG